MRTASRRIAHPGERSSRIFLRRKADRVSPAIVEKVEKFMEARGFALITPEKLSIAEQCVLMSQCDCLVGFSGSQLHNSMFANQGVVVVEIGDARAAGAPVINQALCVEIAQCELRHSPYCEDAEVTIANLDNVLSAAGF
jgi:capsular polysaccharide biosynthesis protein